MARSKKLNKYIRDRMEKTENTNIFRVTQPLYVFKKAKQNSSTRRNVIINLIIPVGALVHIPSNTRYGDVACFDRKMRASKAIVHSIVHEYGDCEFKQAVSDWNSSFQYKKGETVEPLRPFSIREGECRSGIHFFVSLTSALNY